MVTTGPTHGSGGSGGSEVKARVAYIILQQTRYNTSCRKPTHGFIS